MIKAIVLSCDRYHKITDHMIETYQKLWPTNKLKFLIPWNKVYPQFLVDKWGDKIKLIQTPVEFKPTIDGLLKNINENEWVYWCTDDSYLVDLDEDAANASYNFVENCNNNSIYSVIFYNGQYDIVHRTFDKEKSLNHNGYNFFKKNKITYQWQHQFCRSKVIKKMFDCLDEPEFPKQMDHMQKEEKSKEFWNMINEGDWYVIENNSVIMGEPTSRGKLTINGLESFKQYNLTPPIEEFEVGKAVIFKQ
tara:strand:+ start:54 stop:800 length:747 start_codon:yes stop_codon:yes gene_type:complete